MKVEELSRAFKKVKPDEKTKRRMLTNILKEQKDSENWVFAHFLKPIPLLFTFVILLGGFFVYRHFNPLQIAGPSNSDHHLDTTEEGTENGAYEIKDEFQIDDRYYYLLRDEKRKAYGLPPTILEEDIGEQFSTITESIDENLINRDVYHYVPAQSEAIVAVSFNGDYQLYEFFNFESYEEGQDETGQRYLELYGIHHAAHIAYVQFGRFSLNESPDPDLNIISEISDEENIEKFYAYYAQLTNDSDLYFDRLFHWEDHEGEENDSSNHENFDHESSMPAYEGSSQGALEDSVIIRIYQKSGVFFETIYYPNISFISRHHVNNEFREFLHFFLY